MTDANPDGIFYPNVQVGAPVDCMDTISMPYEQLGVDSVAGDIKSKCDSLTEKLLDLYISKDMQCANGFIGIIKGMESMNLQSLMKKVVYLNHMTDTLMKHIDTIGFDGDLYQSMTKLSLDSIDVMNEFTKYVRNVPIVFKSMREELAELSTTQLDNPEKSLNAPSLDANGNLLKPELVDESDQYPGEAIRGPLPLIDGINNIMEEVKKRNGKVDPSVSDPIPKAYADAGETELLNDFEKENNTIDRLGKEKNG